MNAVRRIRQAAGVLMVISVAACGDRITEFGFDGEISGTVTDQSGAPVSGDLATRNLIVLAKGEHDDVPMEIRVKGDGTYANTHLYPQRYQVWVEGPVVSSVTAANPVTVDLTGAPVTQDFKVTPFLSIARPAAAPAASGAISVNYEIRGNEGRVPAQRTVFVSTASWPGTATGSGTSWKTVTRNVSSNAGSVSVSGLTAGKKYYIRVGARAQGTNQWNFSDQVALTAP